MDDLLKRTNQVAESIRLAIAQLNIDEAVKKLQSLQVSAHSPDFWNNPASAQDTMKQISKFESRVTPWLGLHQGLEDLQDLIGLNDSSLQADLEQQLASYEKTYDKLKEDFKFSGPFDDFDALVSIHAGAGGTDAQDWAQMLLRMYVRWAEGNDYNVTTIDESPGEEAGIKSVTLEIGGPYVYGKLKGEHGVHRLVRLSPFNSDNLRQTSFAKVEVLPKIDQPEAIETDEKDLKIDVYRAGGHGGQSVNTTDSAVRITHLPTNIVVAIQNERSQLQNKETAMTILRSKLAQLQVEQHAENLRELKGPNQSAEWGNQIRSYVLHPYKQVKDLRSRYESSDPDKILDGHLNDFINAYLEHTLGT